MPLEAGGAAQEYAGHPDEGPPPEGYSSWQEYHDAKQFGYAQGPRGRVREAWEQEAQSLEAYKELERQRLQKEYAQQLGAAQQTVGGQAAGGNAAMLRGGAYGRGQLSRYGAVDLESQRVAMETYLDNLYQELLARGASYEEAIQAVQDEYGRLRSQRHASEEEAAAQRDAERQAMQERAVGLIMSYGAAGMKGASG